MDARSLIKKILLCFEQSSSIIKYNEVYTYEDGPHDIKQITLSFGLTEYGNLKLLVDDYCRRGGRNAKLLVDYVPKIGKISLADDKTFINLLKTSASDPVMQQCQESAYDGLYIYPAEQFCIKNKLKYNLSKLVIADSFLQSGSILSVIRNSFPATIDNEQEWITQYCQARRNWLANHSREILHSTVYRMDFMLYLIHKNDWNLTSPFYVANDVKIANC